ncbi:MAG: YggS family pyridoxal phosphate-dependent enzyme [Deltaproteobacteria bacterium]|nr:YggS family pyridoxal phosphate-dependent enzyme [Deltaproteobacteria bacterium]
MIKENVRKILESLPQGVQLVAAVKTRTPEEVLEAIQAGVTIIGHNYVQEAEAAFPTIGHQAKWHMIGHLQSNKARKAAAIFDMIETVDSFKLARAINQACQSMHTSMPILIEINSGEELQKAGVMPRDAMSVIREIADLENVKIVGLMTMGPFSGDPEDARPYFRKTREIFETIKNAGIPGVEMKNLSMGMSNSYGVAIEEGANMVRIGTRLFGERDARR